MKRVVIIILTFCYLSGVCAPFYTYVGYWINKDYIAANLCENKDKPEMNCEGKCQLNEQLAKQSEKSQDTNAPQPSSKEFNPHTTASFAFRSFVQGAGLLNIPSTFFRVSEPALACPESPPWLFV